MTELQKVLFFRSKLLEGKSKRLASQELNKHVRNEKRH